MKIRIVEYKNVIGRSGKAMGHGVKVLNEAINLCNLMGASVEVASGDAYCDVLVHNVSEIIEEPFCFVEGSAFSVKLFFRKLCNIRKGLVKLKSVDIVWFTNVDWFLFFYLGIFNVKRNIAITEYTDNCKVLNQFGKNRGVAGKIIRNICLRGYNKVKLHIETYDKSVASVGHIYMPDYLFTDKYKKYISNNKVQRAVIVGTVNNESKDILGVVKVFSQTNYPILIAGEFVDASLYELIDKEKTSNVSLLNKKLEEDEYYKLIATSEYIILPYRMNVYKEATSGVLREAMYLGSKVIAPSKMLLNMQIQGKGYEDISEIPMLIENSDTLPKEIDISECSEEVISAKLMGSFTRFVERQLG